MAMPFCAPDSNQEQVITVTGELISRPYIELTIALMARFGVHVEHENWRRFTVCAGKRYLSPGEIFVEGDASSASYFLAAGAIGTGPVRVEGIGRDSLQGDVRFAEALVKMGARITRGANWMEARAPAFRLSAGNRSGLQSYP